MNAAATRLNIAKAAAVETLYWQLSAVNGAPHGNGGHANTGPVDAESQSLICISTRNERGINVVVTIYKSYIYIIYILKLLPYGQADSGCRLAAHQPSLDARIREDARREIVDRAAGEVGGRVGGEAQIVGDGRFHGVGERRAGRADVAHRAGVR